MPPHKLSHWISNSSFAPPTNALHRLAAGGAIVAGALVVSALVNRFIAKRAERNHPPIGKFVDVGALGSITSNRVTASRWFCCMVTRV